jgi:hypothetical protein
MDREKLTTSAPHSSPAYTSSRAGDQQGAAKFRFRLAPAATTVAKRFGYTNDQLYNDLRPLGICTASLRAADTKRRIAAVPRVRRMICSLV